MTGADVKHLRSKLGLTQAELAAELNKIDPQLRIYPTTVSRWESGRHKPSPHATAALSILERRGVSDRSGAVPLRASEHLELAAAAFEEDGAAGLAAALRKLAAGQRESGHDPLQITPDGMLPH